MRKPFLFAASQLKLNDDVIKKFRFRRVLKFYIKILKPKKKTNNN